VTSCCYSIEAWKLSTESGDSSEMDMLRMMLRHGMLSQTDQDKVRSMIEASESKSDELNMTNKEKIEKNREKWTEFVSLYVERLKKEEKIEKNRNLKMNLKNPKFILRNSVAEKVTQAAEKGDFKPVRRLLELLRNPYDDVITSGNSVDDVIKDEATQYCKLTHIDDIQLKVT